MKIKDWLNKECAHLQVYIGEGLEVRFMPSYWSKDKKTKHLEGYSLHPVDDSENLEEWLTEISREELEITVNDIQKFFRFIDSEIVS